MYFFPPNSNRYGNWHKDKSKDVPQKNVPRIMAFVMGGATYSEFRVGYEVSRDKKSWEIFVGGSHILTPDGFLEDLKKLSSSPGGSNDDDE